MHLNEHVEIVRAEPAKCVRQVRACLGKHEALSDQLAELLNRYSRIWIRLMSTIGAAHSIKSRLLSGAFLEIRTEIYSADF